MLCQQPSRLLHNYLGREIAFVGRSLVGVALRAEGLLPRRAGGRRSNRKELAYRIVAVASPTPLLVRDSEGSSPAVQQARTGGRQSWSGFA